MNLNYYDKLDVRVWEALVKLYEKFLWLISALNCFPTNYNGMAKSSN